MFRFRIIVGPYGQRYTFHKQVEASSLFVAMEQLRSELAKYFDGFAIEETDETPPVVSVVVDNERTVRFKLTNGSIETEVAQSSEIAYLNGYMTATACMVGDFFHLVPLPVELFAALFMRGDPAKAYVKAEV